GAGRGGGAAGGGTCARAAGWARRWRPPSHSAAQSPDGPSGVRAVARVTVAELVLAARPAGTRGVPPDLGELAVARRLGPPLDLASAVRAGGAVGEPVRPLRTAEPGSDHRRGPGCGLVVVRLSGLGGAPRGLGASPPGLRTASAALRTASAALRTASAALRTASAALRTASAALRT